jgi:hypothetical protein
LENIHLWAGGHPKVIVGQQKFAADPPLSTFEHPKFEPGNASYQ